MRQFPFDEFINLVYAIGVFSLFAPGEAFLTKDDHGPDNRTRARLSELLEEIRSTADHVGMNTVSMSAARLKSDLDNPEFTSWRRVGDKSKELIGRLRDESFSACCFFLTLKESEEYNAPLKGWEDLISRFPDIAGDVEEANRCLALGRYPAAIFHSTHIAEVALIELGRFIGVTDYKSGWTATANRLERIMKKSYADLTDVERSNFQFLEQVHATVEALKNAWRNKISHAVGKLVVLPGEYSRERAEEILSATRAFVRRIGEGVPPAS